MRRVEFQSPQLAFRRIKLIRLAAVPNGLHAVSALLRVTRPEQSILTNALKNAPFYLSVIELYPPDK